MRFDFFADEVGLAAARRSVFRRRAARFLTLSLPLLFPIRRNTRCSFARANLFRYPAPRN